MCRELMQRWFPDSGAVYNHRPDWLKNPETGRNLELDIYYPELKLAVEFNGSQHKFLLQRRKDWFKNKQCSERGILMLSVYHPMDLFKCKLLVKNHTGIKTTSGRKDPCLLLKLQGYVSKTDGSSQWFQEEKEKSSIVEETSMERKKERRAAKITERRKAKKVDSVLAIKR